MPRNSSGIYTLPTGNPVITGTIIESDGWANPTLADLAAELTNSLDRAGRGGMTGPFGIVDGTPTAPGLRWTTDPNNGLYRAGSDNWWAVAGSIPVMNFQSNLIAVPTGVQVTMVDAPSVPTSVVNKAYVDAGLATLSGVFLPLTGGTISGGLEVTGDASVNALYFGGPERAGLLYRNAVDQVGMRVGDIAGPDFSYYTWDHNAFHSPNHVTANKAFYSQGGAGIAGNDPYTAAFRASGSFGGGLGLIDGSNTGGVYTESGQLVLRTYNNTLAQYGYLRLHANNNGYAVTGVFDAVYDGTHYVTVNPNVSGAVGIVARNGGHTWDALQAADGSFNIRVNGVSILGTSAARGFSACLLAGNWTSGSAIVFDTVSAPYHNVGGSYNAGTGVYTCPATGTYFVNVNLLLKNNVGSAAGMTFEVRRNGSSIIGSPSIALDNGISGHASFGAYLQLTAGDTLTAHITNATGSLIVVTGSTFTVG